MTDVISKMLKRKHFFATHGLYKLISVTLLAGWTRENTTSATCADRRVARFALVYGPGTFELRRREANRSAEDAAKSGSCSVSAPSTTAESKTVATK